ncbi:MAG: dual specificity protein phosphatase family protein [Acidobacteria bacterium]|nr:dual specificity protein phosphatase family protein [Acidobacteriota bacterium]
MRTELHWVDGPWTGKLAVAARPRGGEWLYDELADWWRKGVHTIFSLLTPEEEQDLDLVHEKRETQALGMTFRSFPIPDRQVPDSETRLAKALEKLDNELASGTNVVLHCRQGIGRSGLVAACLLITKGLDAKAAITRLSAARGVPVPETTEQRRWIEHFASTFANLK